MNTPMLLRELGILLLCLLLPLLGLTLWGISGACLIGLVGYSGYHLYHLHQLTRWLKMPEEMTPVSRGGWGSVFRRLSRYHQTQRRRQKRLSDAVTRIEQTSEAMTDAIVAIDSHGNLDSWNHAAKRIIGLNTAQHRGQAITQILREERFVRYFTEQHYEEPLTLRSPFDSSRVLQCRVTPFGERERLLIVSDITRLHRLEQMRRDFVANVSHELRTPLTVLRGYLETLEQSDHATLPPRLARGIGQMLQQAERMQHLTDDLLMLSRLENDTRTTAQVQIDVAVLIDNVRRDGEALSKPYGHTLTAQVDSAYGLYGDPLEIRSAVTNLVSNAVRYSGQQRTITLRWQVMTSSMGTPLEGILEVADNGEGIDARHLPRLTERFYRVDKGRSSATGGTGLGLAIVKHVMLRHKGHLSIDSAPGEGARFQLHFPGKMLVDMASA